MYSLSDRINWSRMWYQNHTVQDKAARIITIAVRTRADQLIREMEIDEIAERDAQMQEDIQRMREMYHY